LDGPRGCTFGRTDCILGFTRCCRGILALFGWFSEAACSCSARAAASFAAARDIWSEIGMLLSIGRGWLWVLDCECKVAA
jgi:hypothetical protein